MLSNMTISWFQLIAQFCMSLILSSALAIDGYLPSNQNFLSINRFSYIKKQTISCTFVDIFYCKYVCCNYYNNCYLILFDSICCTCESDCLRADSISFTVLLQNFLHQLDIKITIFVSLTYEQPCNPPFLIGSIFFIDNYFYAFCVLDSNYTSLSTSTYNNKAAFTIFYNAAIIPYNTDKLSPIDSYS